jgi:hypothetical protein
MLRTALVAASVALLIPTVSSAFEVQGGQLSFSSADLEGYDPNLYELNGAIEFGNDGPFSLQLELGRARYDGDEYYRNFSAHLVYDIDPTASVGLLYMRETWFGDDWDYFGIEGRKVFESNSMMPVEIEGLLMRGDDDGDTNDIFSLSAYVHVTDTIALGAAVANSSGYDDQKSVGVAAKYMHPDGGYARLGIDELTGGSEYRAITFELGYEFGGGTTFKSKSWNKLFPGS